MSASSVSSRPSVAATTSLRHIVVGGSQAAGAHHEVGTRQRRTKHVRELLAIVAGDALHHDVDAQRVHLLGNEQRVRVDAKRRQQLAADGDDRRAASAASHQPPGRRHPDQSAHHEIAVNRRHPIVSHHAQPAGQFFEAARRPWLDDVEHAEDEEPDDRAGRRSLAEAPASSACRRLRRSPPDRDRRRRNDVQQPCRSRCRWQRAPRWPRARLRLSP